FVLGVPKCGTTTLHQVLMAHPHIFMTSEKEPHFFDTDTYYNRGLDRYLRDHFRGAAGFKARGEASPTYLRSGKARDRIRRDLGKDLRFVVILRDPVKRAWSAYLQECRYGHETESFERALELEPTRLSHDPACAAYFLGGIYARQLRVWFEAFPREHFLVLLTEDLAERPNAVAHEAFAFLDVDPDVEFSPPSRANVSWTPRYRRLAAALNPRRGGMIGTLQRLVPRSTPQRLTKLINRWNSRPVERPPTLAPAVARALRRRYCDEILAVEEIVGRDLGMWRSDD